jgi:hypothetical protein
MAGTTPNSPNISRVRHGTVGADFVLVHPEYQYWYRDWLKIRDCIAGERTIKEKGETYLRKLKGSDAEDYAEYRDRAVFYNMVSQTMNGMIGQVFRREPLIRNLPAKFKDAVRTFAKDGSSHVGLAKTVLSDQIAVSRFGVLVDAPSTPSKTPTAFAVGYQAENILDWDIAVVDGVYQPIRILLREFVRDDPLEDPDPPVRKATTKDNGRVKVTPLRSSIQPSQNPPSARYGTNYNYREIYRELVLEIDERTGERTYVQYVRRDAPNGEPDARLVPMIRGVPLDFIPFKFFGATGNTPDCEKPCLLDIANLNISHYRTYAELEWGRLFTALPVYYAPGGDSDSRGNYHIGPSQVWEVPDGQIPGILEYKGEGLKQLVTALEIKEQQIAAIGGRMMPGMSRSVSESDGQTALREANEQSLLLNVILANEEGMTDVVRWWLMFLDVPLAETVSLRYEINTDFLTSPIGARELRAIQLMYDDGVLPPEGFYEYLRKAEVIPSSMSLEDYLAALKNKDNFFNNPDALAKLRGFASRQQELDQAQLDIANELDRAQLDLDTDTQGRAGDVAEGQLDLARKSQKDANARAKEAAKRPIPAPGAPPRAGPKPPTGNA